MGIDAQKIANLHPRLYHMAEFGSWQSIRTRGLLSTSALLDAYGIVGKERESIERSLRRRSVEIASADGEVAVIRDQRPMSEKKLERCLQDGLTSKDWYQILNERVFFWLTEQRLETLMRAYSGHAQLVLEVDTVQLLERYWERIELTPMNTGCTSPMAFPRGLSSFQAPANYPYLENVKKKGGVRKAIVELTVRYSVPDISELTISAKHMQIRDGLRAHIETLFERN